MANPFNEPRVDITDVDELADDITQHDETDVPVVIEEHHGDGPGDLDELGEGDFVSYEDPDVMEEGL